MKIRFHTPKALYSKAQGKRSATLGCVERV